MRFFCTRTNIHREALRFQHRVEVALWKLGIPLTTRHQEVSPNQFEWAPIFSKVLIILLKIESFSLSNLTGFCCFRSKSNRHGNYAPSC